MAVRVVQQYQVMPGKLQDAMNLSREAHLLIVRHGCKSNRVFAVDIGGENTGEVHAELEFETLEDWVAWRGAAYADPEMQALQAKAASIFDVGATRVIMMSEWPLG